MYATSMFLGSNVNIHVLFPIGYFRVAFCLDSKRVQVQNLSYENKFDLHLNELVSMTHFHMNGFALGLILKQR